MLRVYSNNVNSTLITTLSVLNDAQNKGIRSTNAKKNGCHRK